MKQSEKNCIKIPIKAEKERDLYRKREEKPIQGTPKIILGKAQANLQEIWIDDLKNQQIIKLKQYNNTQKAYLYAKTIVNACAALTNHYGYFIINENMIFFNQAKEIFAWINPDVCQCHVKIYLPHTHEGELAMIRSIIAYLKLWFKCDYGLLTQVKHLNELCHKFQMMKVRPGDGFKPKSPEREFLVNRRNSVNMQPSEFPQRYQGPNLLMDNKSMKDMMGKSPGKELEGPNFLTSSLSGKMSSPLKFPAGNQFEHRTFNNLNTCAIKTPLTNSMGLKGDGAYYPNKTTSNKNNKNHILSLISKQDTSPHEYGKNKILLGENKLQEQEREKMRRGKESLEGIGEELNDLFLSNIENEQENQQSLKQIEEEFSTLLE